ncbi:MoxR family ATPase [Cryptosporangium japonicum]|uniref:AAA family ATPase n=1 Tax=Cryptosporangium japonicum TaxID=80872 RepID=UPI0031DE2024
MSGHWVDYPARSGPDRFAAPFQRLANNLEKVIKGKPDEVRLALCCLFAGGHLLLDDVPGVGKTTLARAIAESIAGSWHRIQFTPDLLPSDITGTMIYRQHTGDLAFRAGPVFGHIVLCDEINRASPKTQSALLEVMEEHQVSIDGERHELPEPFFVVATQNPVDLAGTYPLPEAQLDRFLMSLSLGYPAHAAEVDVLRAQTGQERPPALEPVLTPDDVATMTRDARSTHVAENLFDYVVRIAAETRATPEVRLGVSPRGSLALVRAAQVWAAADGRDAVTSDDVTALTGPVLAHRLILTPEAELNGVSAAELLRTILRRVDAPRFVSGR